jgi:hypothetical protein
MKRSGVNPSLRISLKDCYETGTVPNIAIIISAATLAIKSVYSTI